MKLGMEQVLCFRNITEYKPMFNELLVVDLHNVSETHTVFITFVRLTVKLSQCGDVFFVFSSDNKMLFDFKVILMISRYFFHYPIYISLTHKKNVRFIMSSSIFICFLLFYVSLWPSSQTICLTPKGRLTHQVGRDEGLATTKSSLNFFGGKKLGFWGFLLLKSWNIWFKSWKMLVDHFLLGASLNFSWRLYVFLIATLISLAVDLYSIRRWNDWFNCVWSSRL